MRYKGFVITIDSIDCRDDVMAQEFKTIKLLKSKLKLHKRDSKEYSLLKNNIKEIRFSLSNKVFKVFRVTVKQKQNYLYNDYVEYPLASDIKETVDTFLGKLRAKRNKDKPVIETERQLLGYNYKTVGGVFKKFGTIIDMQKSYDQMSRIQQPKVPPKEFKNNYVGIELELFCKLHRKDLLQKFCNERLAGYVHIKDDGSLRPEQNYIGHEVTILCKQTEVDSIIPKVIKVLRHPDVDAGVNSSCGMHIHIDVRNRDAYVVYDRLVRALPLLTSVVPKERLTNKYCQINTSTKLGDYYNNGNVSDGALASSREERYKAINPMSVSSHKTIEVRLHSGTVNIEKIINWIKLCTSIADTSYSGKIETPDNYFHMIKADTDLYNYLLKRKNLFSKGVLIDTKADYVLDVAAGF